MLQRYKQWSEAFELFLKSPYIGWGPAKEIHSTIVDNEHLFLLRRYGVIGYLAVINLLFVKFELTISGTISLLLNIFSKNAYFTLTKKELNLSSSKYLLVNKK